jgi:hypothetical protein
MRPSMVSGLPPDRPSRGACRGEPLEGRRVPNLGMPSESLGGLVLRRNSGPASKNFCEFFGTFAGDRKPPLGGSPLPPARLSRLALLRRGTSYRCAARRASRCRRHSLTLGPCPDLPPMAASRLGCPSGLGLRPAKAKPRSIPFTSAHRR